MLYVRSFHAYIELNVAHCAPAGCGNVMQNIEGEQTPDADCGSACTGDTSEFCGSAVPDGGPTFTTRQTIYQDTSAPIPFNTCLQTGSSTENLALDAFSQTPPSTAIPLQVTSDDTFPSDFFIFSVSFLNISFSVI